ncbi:MAG TPA: hypothetical protein VEB22_13145 [Phycisphaerales bacterium]|nr:hypothetical protein [Phycisphaerales bacterium]
MEATLVPSDFAAATPSSSSGRRASRRRRWALFSSLAALLLAIGVPPLVGGLSNPIEFNQKLIETLERSHGVRSDSGPLNAFARSWSTGWIALTGGGVRRPAKFDDTAGMVSFVYSWLPATATVYPTEGFYYYKLRDADGAEVWGNLRVAELDSGRLGFAYFHPGSEQLHTGVYEDGKQIGVRKVGDFTWDVTMAGKTVRFVVAHAIADAKANIRLTADETLAGPVFDESGVRLLLLFNTRLNAFYFVLDERAGVTESFETVAPGVLLGRRTAFAFYDDRELDRRLLMGVSLENIKVNNYFDGPGDQVPYWPELRPMIHLAYPHTLKGAGIDEHGVMLGIKEWARIAVSPYIRYADLSEITERVREHGGVSDASVRSVALTKEWWNSHSWLANVISDLTAEGKTLAGVPTCGMAIPTLPGPDGRPLSAELAERIAPLGLRTRAADGTAQDAGAPGTLGAQPRPSATVP